MYINMTIDMSYDNHNSYEEQNFFYLTFSSQTYLLLFTFGANGDKVKLSYILDIL